MASPPLIDPRAWRIISEAYWSAKGWKVPRDEPSPEDFAYAKAAGVMFDKEVVTHDDALTRIVASRALVDLDSVVQGFVASLSSRALHLRSALASYHAVRQIEPHAFVGDPVCASCRQFDRREHDFSSTNFVRIKWGGVPRFFAVDHAFVLERLSVEPRLRPSREDRVILGAILTAADSMPEDARARDLERALRGVFRSNAQERDSLIEILCACGVLTPSRTDETDFAAIPIRSNWTDAPALWRGDDRVNRERSSALFGWP